MTYPRLREKLLKKRYLILSNVITVKLPLKTGKEMLLKLPRDENISNYLDSSMGILCFTGEDGYK